MRRPIVLCALTITLGLSAAAIHAQSHRPDPSTMSAYVMGLYVKGPAWTAERTPHTDSIQAGHLANMGVMHKAGALLGAGPIGGDHHYRGILLFKDLPMESVATLVRRDPAIRDQRLMIELYRWYAPKGIGEAYEARAARNPEHPDSMIVVPMALLVRPSPVPKLDSLESIRVTSGHLGHIMDMLVDGRLLAAGPFFDDGPLRGVSFFAGDTATARRLAMDDPAVKAGTVAIDLMPLWVAWGVFPPTPTVKEMRR